MDLSKYRSNGFEWPPNLYQLLISITVLATTVLCTFTQLLRIPFYLNLIYAFFFYLSLLLTIILWLRASKSDPTDPVVLANRAAIAGNHPFESSRYENMCTICSTSVGYNSKHCGNCNRCVERFDHHCIWLNNCIGASNYSYFFQLICILAFHEVIIFITSLVLIKEFFDGSNLDDKSFIGIQFVLLAQSFILNLFLANLIGLHIWLYKNGLTTYELIKIRNKRKKQVHVAGITEIAHSKISSRQNSKNIYDN